MFVSLSHSLPLSLARPSFSRHTPAHTYYYITFKTRSIGVSQLHTLNIDYRPAPTDVSAATAYATASRIYRQQSAHTPSIAFRHLFPNSARSGYATEGAPLISEQLSADAVSALRKVRVLIRLWKQHKRHSSGSV